LYVYSTWFLCTYNSLITARASSTFFPYTTLFRSLRGVAAILKKIEKLVKNIFLFGGKWYRIGRKTGWIDDAARRRQARERGEERDRKSTRLNSSHVSISYAVFCLKKKKYYERQWS